MTVREITEALDFCSNSLKPCEECPLSDTDSCSMTLMRESLRIIQKQQAEIERLDKDYNTCAKRFYKEGVTDLAERLRSLIRNDIDDQGMIPLPYTKKAYNTVMIFIDRAVRERTEE